MFTPKTSIDEYIDNSELNSRIYDALLKLKGCKSCNQHRLKREPLEIFNEAYAICDELQLDEHPELLGVLIWDRLRDNDYLVCETNIIFSCVYVILTFSETENKNMKHFLVLFKHIIDKGYFKEFEPLIGEELTNITPLSTNFEFLQTEGDKIQDLNQRELFYSGFLAHHKQAHNKGNIEQQVADEIELIHTTKRLADDEAEDDSEVASAKVCAAVFLELLNLIGRGQAHNDLSKISKLIAYLTGKSEKYIYNEIQKGLTFSNKHSHEIAKINKILSDLNISISIEKSKGH